MHLPPLLGVWMAVTFYAVSYSDQVTALPLPMPSSGDLVTAMLTSNLRGESARIRRDTSQSSCGEGDGRFLCPSSLQYGTRVCIDAVQMCDGRTNCPDGEDEHHASCLSFQVLHSYIETLAESQTSHRRSHRRHQTSKARHHDRR